jgi:hypothetical protein
MLKDSLLPNTSQEIGVKPSVFSTEKILTPVNSATNALAMKNVPNNKNNTVRLLSFMIQI